MKHHSGAILIVFIALFMWLSAFWITRSRAISHWEQDNPVWLSNVSDELLQREEAFKQQIAQYTEQLKSGRFELCRLLDNPQTPDDAILNQADSNAQIHTELLMAVGEHIKAMGSTLPDSQKTLLKQFCRQTVGGGMHQRNRYGQRGLYGPLGESSEEPTFGQRLRQRHRRGRCGLVLQLQLTDEQIAIAEEKDPSFEIEIRRLQDQLLSERRTLCVLLESQQTLNGQLVNQIERFINAHNLLERRLIYYVIIMRPHFTPQQQKSLIGLCQRHHACREPGNCIKTEI